MKRWLQVLLLFELVLIGLILVLPQVDLPDTAFRDGNTPLSLRFGVHVAPAVNYTFSALEGTLLQPGPLSRTETHGSRPRFVPATPLLLVGSLRC